jgi:hypothetical protein
MDVTFFCGYSRNGRSGNSRGPSEVHPNVTHLDWTDHAKVCDPSEVSAVTDPMLVVRRHVDLLRVRSAICRPAR